MASVVYDGVGGGGTLFGDIKFFLMQRLPTRDHWKQLIKANGGHIVPLEKQADIIIADHALKNCPAGSISWKFIEQSVKKGELEDLEDYRAGRPVGTIREIRSGEPARKGRTPFTAEDDRILMEWCVKAERQGLSLLGNDLYKQLEEKNNRHTFQSWRDHWIKHLSRRPRPALPEDDENDQDDEPPAHDGPTLRTPVRRRDLPVPAIRPRATPATSLSSRPPQSRIASEIKAARNSTPAPSIKPAANNHFTNEDTELLEEFYADILNIDSDQEIAAWQAWAEKYPSHTAQEWRNYFQEYLVPKMESMGKKSSEKPTSEISTPPLRGPKATLAFNPSSQPDSVKAREIRDSQDTPGHPTRFPRERNGRHQALTDVKLFKERATLLAAEFEAEGKDLDVDFEPTICGRKIPLFRLWQVVLSDEFGGFDRVNGLDLWSKVATTLNFNQFKHTTAADELKTCYSGMLADLEAVFFDTEELPDPTESEEREMLEAQLFQTAARETQDLDEEEGGELELEQEDLVEEEEDDDLDGPQYSPHLPIRSSCSKRSFGNDRTNVDISYNKRQRIDKGKGKELEIPSTPEDVINSNQLPRPSLPKPSPLKYPASMTQQTEEEDSSEIEELLPADPFKVPSNPRSKRAAEIIEPETQDFQYPQTQFEPEAEEEDHDSFVEIASSPPRQKLPDRSSGSNAANKGSDPVDSSTQSQTESVRQAEQQAKLTEYIDHRVSLGYTEQAVAIALDATTMEIGPHCDQTMEAVETGLPIPDDVPGVWTEKDDELVEQAMETKGFRDMVRKHGIARCHTRRAWLVDRRIAAEEEERDS